MGSKIGREYALVFAVVGLAFAILILTVFDVWNIFSKPQNTLEILAGVIGLFISASWLGAWAGSNISECFTGIAVLRGITTSMGSLIIAIFFGSFSSLMIATNFQSVFQCISDYFIKPFLWIMPIGTIFAIPLGSCYGIILKNKIRD